MHALRPRSGSPALNVLFRADIAGAATTPSAESQQWLRNALGAHLGAIERARTGGWRVGVDPPLADSDARVVVDKLRNVRDVLYADPSFRQPANVAQQKASADNALPTDQIIVTLRGTMRLSASHASNTNFVPDALNVSTYAYNVGTGRYLYFFVKDADKGAAANSW